MQLSLAHALLKAITRLSVMLTDGSVSAPSEQTWKVRSRDLRLCLFKINPKMAVPNLQTATSGSDENERERELRATDQHAADDGESNA